MADLTLITHRGGMNNEDAPSAVEDDQVVLAKNVEFFFSALGERRNGCEPIDMTGAGATNETEIVHLSQNFPTNDIKSSEWWAIGLTPGVSATVSKRTVGGSWGDVTPNDDLSLDAPDIYEVVAQSLHGKHFFAYHSDEDRLHLWDGTSWRRTGLAEPDAPTAADEGSGTFSGVRYYRIRYVEMDGSTVVRRSEPSESYTFTPSGSGDGATVTKSAAISEGETHWELEASTDDATFYRIARTAVGTTTVDDGVVYGTGYADSGTLSEEIGQYLLQPSARFIAADGDRLLLGGHWTDEALQSRVWWSPVFNDPGAGNDERQPLASLVNNYVDLDNYEGGALTGISQVVNGTWYAFKWGHIYKMARTGDVNRAYEVITVSKARGAMPGSIVSGMDENGRPCIYFMDPIMGPSRLGLAGLETIRGMRSTYSRMSLNAEKVSCRGVYYPDKRQVHWWMALDGADSPNHKIVLQVNEIRSGDNGAGRGWSFATGRISEALSVAIFNELVSDGTVTTLSERPFIGLSAPDFVQRCDTGDDDAGVSYKARIVTHPYFLAGMLNKWGAMAGALLATAIDRDLVVRTVRDFGLETLEFETNFSPVATEDYVIKFFDNLKMSEGRSIHFEFKDPD